MLSTAEIVAHGLLGFWPCRGKQTPSLRSPIIQSIWFCTLPCTNFVFGPDQYKIRFCTSHGPVQNFYRAISKHDNKLVPASSGQRVLIPKKLSVDRHGLIALYKIPMALYKMFKPARHVEIWLRDLNFVQWRAAGEPCTIIEVKKSHLYLLSQAWTFCTRP